MTISKYFINKHNTRITISNVKNFSLFIIVVTTIFGLISCSQIPTPENPKTIEKKISFEDIDNYKKALEAINKNNFDKAESLLEEFIAIQPNLAGAWANLGLIYYKKNKLIKSKKYNDKAISLNPKNAYAHNLLGLINTKNDNFRNAERHYLLAIKNKKNYANAHYNLALLYDIYFQEIKKSITHYQRYLKIIKKQGLKDKQTVDWLEQLENSLKKG